MAFGIRIGISEATMRHVVCTLPALLLLLATGGAAGGEAPPPQDLDGYFSQIEAAWRIDVRPLEMELEGRRAEALAAAVTDERARDAPHPHAPPLRPRHLRELIKSGRLVPGDREVSNLLLSAGQPALAARLMQGVADDGSVNHYLFACRLSYAFVLAGDLEPAATTLEGLLQRDMKRDSRRELERRVRLLRSADAAAMTASEAFEKLLDPTLAPGLSDRPRPTLVLLAIWRWPGGDRDGLDRARLLMEQLRAAGDTHGQRLALAHIADLPDVTPRESAAALLEAGSLAFQANEDDAAAALWRRVEQQGPARAAEAWGKAVFNVGVLLKRRGDLERAIDQFAKLLDSPVDDREPGGHIMEAYRNYRPRAQWEIGHCYFEMGNFIAALEAYRTVREKYPFQSWCGNAKSEYQVMYAFREALCHEHLGDMPAAVERYIQAAYGVGMATELAAHRRLADLYEASDQTHDLLVVLDHVDEALLRAATAHDPINEAGFRRHTPTAGTRRLLELRQWGREGRFEMLIALLGPERTVARPHDADARRQNWQADEAARVLARYPRQAVPLLRAKLEEGAGDAEPWLLYALGLAATPEAVEVMKRHLPQVTNLWDSMGAVYALGLAGKAGEEAIDELAQTADGHLLGSIRRWKRNELRHRDEFPAIADDAALPALDEVTISRIITAAR